MRTLLLSVCTAGTLLGCVSSGKYEDLKTKYDQAESQNGALQHGIMEREHAAQAMQARLAQVQAQLDQQKAQLAAQTTQLAQLDVQQKSDAQKLSAQSDEASGLRSQLADVVKDRSRLKATTDDLRAALLQLAQNKAASDLRVAEYRNLLTRFKTLIDAGQLSVKIVEGRMVLALPTDVLFDSGSAKLSKDGKQTVLSVAQVLSSMNANRFQIEGHTDNVPISTARFPSNWELAEARALGVLKSMVEAGMPNHVLSAASYGEFHPVASNDSDATRAANRRIEIVLVPDLSAVPDADELQRAVSGR